MIQIRNGCFETNSSSLHTICIHKDYINPVNLKELHFRFGEFGQVPERYGSIEEKASYLWTLICQTASKPRKIREKKSLIRTFISELSPDMTLTFDKFRYDQDDHCIEIDGFVDKPRGAMDFLEYVLSDKKHLFQYLFGSKSFIMTGNDYEPADYPIVGSVRKDKDYKIFLKGN